MENIKKYSKLKSDLLHKKEMALIKNAGSLQKVLIDAIFEDFVSKLDVENGYVKNTKKNKDRINTLNRIFEKFNNNEMLSSVAEMVAGLKDIQNLNINYYSQFNAKRIQDIEGRVFDKVKSNLGLDGNKLVKNGFLDSFIKDQSLLNKVKQVTLQSVTSDNITMRDYQKSIKILIEGNDKVDGGLVRHFKTFATDTYSMFDRATNKEFATTLGLQYAVYAGGIIETSRPFCEIRNNKVFTSEEIERFGTSKDKYGGYISKKDGTFQGKPKDVYDPFTQCGGYNCRHTLNYISKALALRMRPDLNT